MLLRRNFALTVGALALLAPALTACGFDRPTDAQYTPSAGTINRSGDVHVLNAAIVAGQSDSGTLVAGVSNSVKDAAVSLTGIEGDGLTVDLAGPIEVSPQGFVNLADEELAVTGEFDAGNVLDMTLTFDNGDVLDLEVPVVTNCDEFEGFDVTAEGESTDERYSCEYPETEGHH